MDKELKRAIIMENYSNPINRKRMEGYETANTRNSSCIDNIDLYVDVKDDVIKDITFEGEACAISISSTSIMINNLIGKTIAEAKEYIKNFENMINEKDYDKDLLKEAIVYDEIYKQANRKTCALLPYEGIKKIIDKK